MISLSSVAFSEGSYIGGNISSINIEAGGEGPRVNALIGRFGTALSETMSGEFRVGFGLGSDKYNGTEFELENMYGAYLKIGSSTGEVNPYVIVGLTKGKIDHDSGTASEDDFSVGLGLDFGGGFNLEYMNYMDKDGVELNGFALGFASAF